MRAPSIDRLVQRLDVEFQFCCCHGLLLTLLSLPLALAELLKHGPAKFLPKFSQVRALISKNLVIDMVRLQRISSALWQTGTDSWPAGRVR
jgi:hypothetical protein